MNPVKVSGTLEALGQHTFDNDSYTYAYLRFKDLAGQVITKEQVTVHNGCNSYLCPDLQGDFYFAKFGKYIVLYGLKVSDRSVNDTDQALKGRIARGIAGGLLFVIGIPLLFLFFLGVPLMYVGWQLLTIAVTGPNREKMAAFMNNQD